MTFPPLLAKSGLSAANLETMARLEHLYQARRETHKLVATARDYYQGDHPSLLTDRQQEFLHHRRGLKFCLNYCRVIVDAVAERLHITGFSADDPQVQNWLASFWRAAAGDSLSSRVHLAALRDGAAFVLVDYDPRADRPRLSLNLADDGGGGLSLHYDEYGQPAYAAKRWTVDQGAGMGSIRRLTLYYADRIEKYFSNAAAPYWQPLISPDEPWPLPWLDRDGFPLGLPVIAFQNRDDGLNGGESELSDIIPLQDALNKALIDLVAVADTNAFPLLVALGFSLPDDFTVSPGALIQVPPSLDGRSDFKLIPGANLSNFIEMLDHLVLEMARISSTPLSRLQANAQVAAEGTLKQQEVGLIAKVEHKQITFGAAWAEAMRYAMRLQDTFGALQIKPNAVETLWRPAAPRSERDQIETLLLKAQLGIDPKLLRAEAGYPD